MGADSQMLSRLVKRMKNRHIDPLRPLIDEYLLARPTSPNRLSLYEAETSDRARPGGRISPSSVGGCEREAVLKFLGARGRRVIDPDSQLIFDDGNWRHHKWQFTFRDMEAVLGTEAFEVVEIEGQSRSKTLRVAGNFDAWVRMAGDDYIIDFKGANDAMFNRVNRDDEPMAKHVMQLLLYMKTKKVQKGIILYENKNNQLTKSFVITFDRAEWATTVDWISSVLNKIESKKLPAKPASCASGNFQYERCPYARLCYGGMTHEEISTLAYKDFTSIDDLWKRGIRAARQ